MNILSCDLETTTEQAYKEEGHVREWAVGVYNIYTEEYQEGTSLEWFFAYLENIGNSKAYFHNVKFDGSYLIDWLFRNGFEHTEEKKLQPKEFNTLISDMGQFYSIKVSLSNDSTVTFFDSNKIIPMSVRAAAKAFGLKMSKGEIDYHKPRPVGYQLDANESDYLKRDCVIVGQILKMMFEQGLDRMTQGSNALASFKKSLPRKFEKIFPKLDIDSEIRPAYKGGYTYAAPQYQGKNLGFGKVYDKNSMYPSMMKYKPMPYGKPQHYDGKYEHDKIYNLYIQKIEVIFELKPKHLPTIQIKNGYRGFLPTEYVQGSNGEPIVLTMTNIDLELFKEQYEILDIEYIEGWKFQGTTGLFDAYIDYWYEVKEKATREGNKGLRTMAKLMLNALYGKLATSITVKSKIPYFDWEERKVKYRLSEAEERDPVYLPAACFITAYAREDLIRNAQANYDRFAYADTDSLHLVGHGTPEGLDIDPYRLGAWGLESVFYRARFLRAKCYIEEHPAELPKCPVPQSRGRKLHLSRIGRRKSEIFRPGRYHTTPKMQVTCAGMPYDCHSQVTWENFAFGTEYTGKKQFKIVSGGGLLIETTYKLKLA